MKAIIKEEYGPPSVLRLEEVEKPLAGENEILVKIIAASANPADWHLMRADPSFVRLMSGLFKPKDKMFGVDFAGIVAAVGKNITQFQSGDRVFGGTSTGTGAFAEFVCVAEKDIVHMPQNISFEEAAAVPVASLTALQALRDTGQIKSGEQVLIVGASGGVGSYAVQLANNFGAQVTGVCSASNVDLVSSLGAVNVLDYTKIDIAQCGQQFDLIIDIAGDIPISVYKNLLNPGGRWVLIGGQKFSRFLLAMLFGPLMSKIWGKKMTGMMAQLKKPDLEFMVKLIEQGRVRSVIDRRYPLEQTPEAIAYLETGRAKGKVIINIGVI